MRVCSDSMFFHVHNTLPSSTELPLVLRVINYAGNPLMTSAKVALPILYFGIRGLEHSLGGSAALDALTQRDPLASLNFRLAQFWIDSLAANAYKLAHAQESGLNKFYCPSQRGLSQLQELGASILDQLRAIQQHETARAAMQDIESHYSSSSSLSTSSTSSSPMSDLHRWALHSEVTVLWLMGLLASRTRLARTRQMFHAKNKTSFMLLQV